jgi:hypothetical protein
VKCRTRGEDAVVAVGGDGEEAERTVRPAWRQSDWIPVAGLLGFVALVVALDWIVNGRLTYLAAVAIGGAVGLALVAIRLAWRRRSGRS